MKKVVISQANELVRVSPESIAYIASDGNYCQLHLIDQTELVFSFNLQHFQTLLVNQLGTEAQTFLRIGKSLIINRDYIFRINPIKQQLVLTDPAMRGRFNLTASKEALRQVKQLIEDES